MNTTFEIERNERFDLAFRFVSETGENIFLTGKAGTGKTTFLRYLRDHCLKTTLVAAPTGVAAINAGGVTLHSLFQIPFGPFIPSAINKETLVKQMRMGDRQRNILRAAELLIIDEISMVRADVLDAIDTILRHVRKNHQQAFGGLQLLFIGDLHQLPPVVRDQDWALLREYYKSAFFFDSVVMRESLPMLLELNKIYRQKNESFTSLLNSVRLNRLSSEEFNLLNSRFRPGFEAQPDDTYITLTSHNRQADLINVASLAKLPSEPVLFRAEISGDFPETMFPAEEELRLKEGAQVMFIKNDVVSRRYYNGKIGTIESFRTESALVRCGDDLIEVFAVTWDNTRYQLNPRDGKLQQEIVGTFTQFPLRLAWAITIHKSQGLTFDKMMLDAALAFSTGQVYVALSRSTTLEGIVLLSKIPPHAIQSNRNVEDAHQRLECQGPLEERFANAQKLFQYSLLSSAFSFEDVAAICSRLRKAVMETLKQLSAEADRQAGLWQNEIMQLQSTAAKFDSQLQQMILSKTPATDSYIQERIVAAANHFQPKTFGLFELIENQTIVTDSKEAAELIAPVINELSAALHLKVYVLTILKETFSVHEFYKAKAKYSPHKPGLSIYSVDKRGPGPDSSNTDLMAELKAWRNAVCQKTGDPVYKVATQSELNDICMSLPRTKTELGIIKGFGMVKLRRFGDDILEMVIAYADKYNLDSDLTLIKVRPKRSAKKNDGIVKPSSSEVSFGLLKDGLKPEEISQKRGLATGTILTHLQPYLTNGTVPIDAIFSEHKIRLAESFLAKHGGKSYSEIKDLLPAGLSYDELRMIKGVGANKV